jgi:hypothetical protein
LRSCTPTIAVGSAVAKMPNMWNPWKRNISWIRNHEITSAFVIVMPKRMPTRR